MTLHYHFARYKGGIHYLTIRALQQAERPLTTHQLVKKILDKRTLKTKTPDASLRSVISRSPYIIRDGRGVYKLNAAGKNFYLRH